MQLAQTIDIAHEGRIAVGREAQVVAEALRRAFRSLRKRVRPIPFSEAGRTAPGEPAPLTGYYAGAYERVTASVPVTSL